MATGRNSFVNKFSMDFYLLPERREQKLISGFQKEK